MKNNKKKYCTQCGSLKTPFFKGTFSPINGQREYKNICSNMKCEIGCGKRTGHIFRNMFSLNNSCKNCGFISLLVCGL